MRKNIIGMINHKRFDALEKQYNDYTRIMNRCLDDGSMREFLVYQQQAHIAYMQLRSMIKFD